MRVEQTMTGRCYEDGVLRPVEVPYTWRRLGLFYIHKNVTRVVGNFIAQHHIIGRRLQRYPILPANAKELWR